MQLSMDLLLPHVDNSANTVIAPEKSASDTLENYIKVCGLIAYKDFFMKIKTGLIAIPEGLTKEQYLTMAREVYESRSAKVNRQKSRSKYFAIRNKNRK